MSSVVVAFPACALVLAEAGVLDLHDAAADLALLYLGEMSYFVVHALVLAEAGVLDLHDAAADVPNDLLPPLVRLQQVVALRG